MRVHIISDIVFDPIVRELKSNLPEFEISAVYEEDPIIYLMNFDKDNSYKDDMVFVHSDQLFHLRDNDWQVSLLDAVQNYADRTKGKILISNSIGFSFSSNPLKKSTGFWSDAALINKEKWDTLLSGSNVFQFDFIYNCSQIGLKQAYNYNLGHLYQMPYTKPLIKQFALALKEQLVWLTSEEKKVIIVDCDNTLWKGVVGEDGIVCDKNSEGILHLHLQQFLKAKKNEGFLLTLCTKNNYEDVKRVFDNKRMPLGWDDFVIKKINWEDKWSNIKSIASELNLGIDSFIFIDDNPFELNFVLDVFPKITCFEFNSYEFFLKLSQSFVFKRRFILQDDVVKSKKYKEEFQRKSEEIKYDNFDQFINSLDIRIDIRFNDISDLERLSQMTGKTNQFNFNKKEYTRDQLEEFINANNRIYSLKLSDKFGDYGTVGLILIKVEGKRAIQENYLMSCRALGKKVETTFYHSVVEMLAKDNIRIEEYRFTGTEKNEPAQEFYKTIINENNG